MLRLGVGCNGFSVLPRLRLFACRRAGSPCLRPSPFQCPANSALRIAAFLIAKCQKVCYIFHHEFRHFNCQTDSPAHIGNARRGALQPNGVLGLRNTCVCGPILVSTGQGGHDHACNPWPFCSPGDKPFCWKGNALTNEGGRSPRKNH